MNTKMMMATSEEPGTWDVTVGDEYLFVGVLERINVGDDDQYMFTDTFGHQINLDDAGTPAEAMEEVTHIFETSTRH